MALEKDIQKQRSIIIASVGLATGVGGMCFDYKSVDDLMFYAGFMSCGFFAANFVDLYRADWKKPKK